MMYRLGVILVSLAVLFSLTSMALSAAGRLWHPVLTVVALASTFGLGVILLID
jgi:hypothetical protein